MAQIQAQRWCKVCGRKTLHARSTLGNGVGCLLSVLTLGLFIPVWLAIGVLEGLFVRWRCQFCGGSRVT